MSQGSHDVDAPAGVPVTEPIETPVTEPIDRLDADCGDERADISSTETPGTVSDDAQQLWPLLVHQGVPWLIAMPAFAIALQTASRSYDLGGSPGWALAIVSAAAAWPLALITSRWAPVAWAFSAGTALLFSQSLPVLEDSPWPWPSIHGLVMLALMAAVTARPPTRWGVRVQAATVIAVWLLTATLVGASSAEPLRAGWVLGVTAVAACGVALGRSEIRDRLTRLLAQQTSSLRTHPALDQLEPVRQAFLDAVVTTPSSPPLPPTRATSRLAGTRWMRAAVIARTALTVVVAGYVFLVTMVLLWDTSGVWELLSPIVALPLALAVVFWRNHALVCWRMCGVLTAGYAVVHTFGSAWSSWLSSGPFTLPATWIAMAFVVSLRHDRLVAVWVWAITAGVIATGHETRSDTAALTILALTALMVIGALLRARRLAAHDLEQQREVGDLEKARRTVLEERSRIARDLHDVVAHHMSMVVVQAESAPYRLPGMPPEIRAEFGAVSASARQALAEIRSLLGVLRSSGQEVITAPQPGVAQVAELVATAAESGVRVDYARTGPEPALSTTAEQAVYRIVQESLANAARHAPGAPVHVRLDGDTEAVHLRVVNGPPAQAVTRGPPGHGLLGMRERTHVVGGQFSAGPLAGGGFAVTATFPVEPDGWPR